MAGKRIGVRGGHTNVSRGAKGYLDEVDCNRDIYPLVVRKLSDLGNTVIDLTPPDGYWFPAELMYGINKANESKLDFSCSIHLNSATSSEANGVEVWVHDKDEQWFVDKATEVCKSLSDLGFKNRGIKRAPSGRALGEISATIKPHMIIEVCFVNNLGDKEIYNKVGANAIANAIVKGLVGVEVIDKPVEENVNRTFLIMVDSSKVPDYLNIRRGPGTNYTINGSIKPNGVKYTIVEVKGDWGRLKSGAGWIHLGYCKRV